MKKINVFVLFFGLFISLNTPSIADSQTMLKITDSSQMNLERINKISSVVDEGGVILGTIVSWPHSTYSWVKDINGEKCTYTSANTTLPRCKWALCNGSTVDPVLYPEYASIAEKTPSLSGDVPYGRVDGDLDYMDPSISSSSKAYHRTLKAPFRIEIDMAINDSEDKNPSDGLIGLKTLKMGPYPNDGVYESSNNANTFTLSSGWNANPKLGVDKVATSVLYYIRIAN